MSKLHTHYDNLKISRTAPPEVIKAAYKSLVQKYHPDRNANDPRATEILKVINEAFEVLSDPVKRQKHDRWIDEQERLVKQNSSAQSSPTGTYGSNTAYAGYQYASQTASQAGTNEPSVSLFTKIQIFFYKLKIFVKNAFFIALLGYIFFAGGKEILNGTLTNTDTTSADTSANQAQAKFDEPSIPPQPLPNTGDTNNPSLVGVAPLDVKTSVGDGHYWLKVVDYYTNQEVVSYFIQGGDTLNVMLPAGTYKIKYASGQNWYGPDKLFGNDTAYAEAQDIFTFSSNGYSYSGYTIELIPQTGGNLQTTELSKEQF
jgi:curved DNA-binding protein CbpA